MHDFHVKGNYIISLICVEISPVAKAIKGAKTKIFS